RARGADTSPLDRRELGVHAMQLRHLACAVGRDHGRLKLAAVDGEGHVLAGGAGVAAAQDLGRAHDVTFPGLSCAIALWRIASSSAASSSRALRYSAA